MSHFLSCKQNLSDVFSRHFCFCFQHDNLQSKSQQGRRASTIKMKKNENTSELARQNGARNDIWVCEVDAPRLTARGICFSSSTMSLFPFTDFSTSLIPNRMHTLPHWTNDDDFDAVCRHSFDRKPVDESTFESRENSSVSPSHISVDKSSSLAILECVDSIEMAVSISSSVVFLFPMFFSFLNFVFV